MTETVLVTGACGFIGSHIVQELLNNNYTVIGIDINLNDDLYKNIPFTNQTNIKYEFQDKLILYKKDIFDCTDLFNYHNINYICHQAALISIPESINKFNKTMRINVEGTHFLMNLAVQFRVYKFIFASSASVYDPDKSPYAYSKKVNELTGTLFHTCYGLKTVGLRYFNVFGEGQKSKGMVIPSFTERIEMNEPLVIYGDGEQHRDFVHVKDVARANVLAIKCEDPELFGTTVDIGSGETISIQELGILLQTYYNKNHLGIIYDIKREGDLFFTKADISLARRYMGFIANICIKKYYSKN